MKPCCIGSIRTILGEGPLWSARDCSVYWVDILAPAVHRYCLIDGSCRSWAMPESIGWVVERREQPGFVAGMQSGFAELSLEPLVIRSLGNPEPKLPGNRLNDAKAALAGGLFEIIPGVRGVPCAQYGG